MADFTERLTAPTPADKRWVSNESAYGGYNDCLVIDTTNGFVLPNCTGYVHGRWMEIGKTNTEYKLSTGNAGNYWSYTQDGYERGSEPKQGACICFSVPGEAGHVAVVERIIDSDSILCSESDYGGAVFTLRYRYRKYGWNPSAGWNTVFQGYIYHPDIEGGGPEKPVYPIPGPKPTERKRKIMIFKRRR